MKNLFALLLILSATTSSVSYANETEFAEDLEMENAIKSEMDLEYYSGIQGSACLDNIESILADITHPSFIWSLNVITGPTVLLTAATVREAVLYNLEGWAWIVKEISKNLRNNVSNQAYYTAIAKQLKISEAETVLGIEVGKQIVSCVRPLLNFKGSIAQQKSTAAAALARITKIRQAVK